MNYELILLIFGLIIVIPLLILLVFNACIDLLIDIKKSIAEFRKEN